MFERERPKLTPCTFLPPWEAIHYPDPPNARVPDDEVKALRSLCNGLNSYIEDLPNGPQTMSEIAAWLRQYRRVLAFYATLTWDEIDLLEAMEGADPLFYTPDQHALADRFDEQVGERDEDEQWRADAEAHPVKADLYRRTVVGPSGDATAWSWEPWERVCKWAGLPGCVHRDCRACKAAR